MTQIVSLEDIMLEPSRNGLTKPKRVRGVGTKMINMGELFANDRIKDLEMDRVPLEDKERITLLNPYDLLFARQSLVLEGAGKCALFISDSEEVCFESHIIRVRIDQRKADPRYIFYWFQSPDGRSSIRARVEQGAGAAGIRGSDLQKIKIRLPSLSIQKNIADCLETIDEKIELNRKINKTLEHTGRALFRYYFIDNPEAKNWRSGTLKDVVDNIKKPLKAGAHLAGRIYIPIDCLQMRGLSIHNSLNYTEAKSSLVSFEKDDILVGAMRVYFHRVNLAPTQGVTRTTTFVLRPKEGHLRAFATFLIDQDSTIAYANTHSKGTTMPYAIWENGLGNMTIKIPPDELLQKFQLQTGPMLEIIRDSHQQIQTLAALRDTLIPRLINGKIKL